MSYRLRLILTTVLLIALTVSIGGTILISASFQTFLKAETETALDSYQSVVNTLCLLTSVNKRAAPEELGQVLSQTAQLRGWQAVSLWQGEELIYRSGDELLRDYLLQTEEPNQCVYVQVNDGSGRGLVVSSRIDAGKDTLRLLGRYDLSSVYEARDIQERLFITVYVAVLFFGSITAVILSYALTKKLRRLMGAVRRISKGDLATRSRISSQDEFGQLSRNFDAMADKLQENIAQLESSIQQQENFMGAFAHEMKTPMTSIIGFADLLRQGNLDENTRMMAAEYIFSEGHRLERLSFKMLDLLMLKKDSVVMKEVWLPSFVEEIDKAMSPNLRNKGIRFVCRSGRGRVMLEPDLMKSLLYNLIDNASKAIEKDGIIALKAAATEDGAQFQVVDNGRGMEKEELGKITEAFYRVDKARSRAQGGAGLGLALCKQIVQLHNGEIQFASAPGKGTSVRVTIHREAGGDRE